MEETSQSPAPSNSSTPAAKQNPTQKDRACPFCNQPFTSSSLGRHLDLYIKEKNPKPPDGVHDVEEIRRMRSAITRRQPRNSGVRRQAERHAWSTPRASHGPEESRTPGGTSQNGTSATVAGARDGVASTPKMNISLNAVNWEATGVINDIPAPNGERSMDTPSNANTPEDTFDSSRIGGAAVRRSDGHSLSANRVVNKKVATKAELEQKQKLNEAIDHARAAELALREIMLSLRAAGNRTRQQGPFDDYDPLALDFPSLTLHCLKPPPTLLTSPSPLPSPSSWSISPPGQQQYEALRNYFQEKLRKWRIILQFKPESRVEDDFNINFNILGDDRQLDSEADETNSEILEKVHEQEEQILRHLDACFSHWTSIPALNQSQIWSICLAKEIASRDSTISKLEEKQSFIIQQNNNLRQQVDQLSRYQWPREFRLRQPETIYVAKDLVTTVAELFTERDSKNQMRGFELADKDEELGSTLNRYIERWKQIVKEDREVRSGTRTQRSQDTASVTRQQPLSHTGGTAPSNNTQERGGDGDADMEDQDAPADEIYDTPMDTGDVQERTAPPAVAKAAGGDPVNRRAELNQNNKRPFSEANDGPQTGAGLGPNQFQRPRTSESTLVK